MRLKAVSQEYQKTLRAIQTESGDTSVSAETKNTRRRDAESLKQNFQSLISALSTKHVFDGGVNILLGNASVQVLPDNLRDRDSAVLRQAAQSAEIKSAIVSTIAGSGYDLPKGQSLRSFVEHVLSDINSPEAQSILAKSVDYNGVSKPFHGYAFKYFYALCVYCRCQIKKPRF